MLASMHPRFPAPTSACPLRRRSHHGRPEPDARGMRGRRRGGEEAQLAAGEGGTELAALWPLTGEPVKGETPNRPVLVTKIDNTSSSKPQLGLKKADLVTEVLVEGGMTRLAVFFYQHLPKVAGPVRSMRASDIGIVKPAHGLIVASGGAGGTVARMKRAKVPFVTEGGPGFFREGSPVGAVQPDGEHAQAREGQEGEGSRARELSALGQGVRLQGHPGREEHRREVQPLHHHVVALQGRQVPQPEQLRGRRRTVRAGHRSSSSGSSRKTPATATRPATTSPRRSMSARAR